MICAWCGVDMPSFTDMMRGAPACQCSRKFLRIERWRSYRAWHGVNGRDLRNIRPNAFRAWVEAGRAMRQRRCQT